MKLIKIGAVALLALAGGVQAAGENDVGLAASSVGPFLSAGIAPDGAICPTAGPIASSFGGVNTQLGRIFRDGIASACPNKVYPGIFNAATTFNYEAFTYTNTSAAAACVTVNFDPDAGATPCGTNAHASAYIGNYDPNNQATNFVGDVGSSIAQPFLFEVPASSDMVLVVTNTASAAVCDFSFEIVNLPCVAVAPFVPSQPVPANDRRALALLAALIVLVGSFAVSRTR